MCGPLPQGNFKWLKDDDLANLDFTKYQHTDGTGYILEVDLRYPENLHQSHQDYPLAPEKKLITWEMLSVEMREYIKSQGLKYTPQTRLIPTLFDKKKYVLHINNLKFYVSQGLKVDKIHRGISFSQSSYLKSYIDLNTQKRKEAQNDFQKDFFKLLNNCIFGKTLQNPRKYRRIVIASTQKQLRTYCNRERVVKVKIINENMAVVELKKTEISLNRPIFIGMVS